MARLVAFTLAVALFAPAFAQKPIGPRNTYERLICVVPMIGAGTAADPRRPMFVPLPETQTEQSDHSTPAIVAFSSVVSDNGQYAVVEFVARDRSAFRAILSEKRADVRVFEKGKARKTDIDTEVRKFKADFDLDNFGVALP
jgi:hypothetical protein